jgi:hypothetical protein
LKVSNNYKDLCQSSGGILAISILVILILFAIFSTAGKRDKLSKMTADQIEDMQEQKMEAQEKKAETQMGNQRNVTVKEGQNLVVF